MAPAIEPGDWLLVDPTTVRWPRRGSIVVFREPDGGALAVKRVAARPGDRVAFAQGYLELADDEAWLLSDASPRRRPRAGSATRSTRAATARSRSSCSSGGRGSATRRCAASAGSPRATDGPDTAAPQPRLIPAARQSSANAACASIVGDQRVGKQTIRSSPISANPASVSTRSCPTSRISSSRV